MLPKEIEIKRNKQVVTNHLKILVEATIKEVVCMVDRHQWEEDNTEDIQEQMA